MKPPAERLRELDSCSVSDALDALGLAGVVPGIRRLSTKQRIAGPVVTVRLEPSRGEPSKHHLGVMAVEQASRGDVVVVANHGRGDAAAWGGLLSLAAGRRGVAGVIVDGMCRDLDEADEIGFPVFARGGVPVTARGRYSEAATNEPVAIGGIEVQPGDLVLADGSGVVFISTAQAERVLDASEEISSRERQMAESIRGGKPLAQVLGRRYERMLERWTRP